MIEMHAVSQRYGRSLLCSVHAHIDRTRDAYTHVSPKSMFTSTSESHKPAVLNELTLKF